jgi:hypothetical protein
MFQRMESGAMARKLNAPVATLGGVAESVTTIVTSPTNTFTNVVASEKGPELIESKYGGSPPLGMI